MLHSKELMGRTRTSLIHPGACPRIFQTPLWQRSTTSTVGFAPSLACTLLGCISKMHLPSASYTPYFARTPLNRSRGRAYRGADTCTNRPRRFASGCTLLGVAAAARQWIAKFKRRRCVRFIHSSYGSTITTTRRRLACGRPGEVLPAMGLRIFYYCSSGRAFENAQRCGCCG